MLDHITIGVTDIARARAFFDVALAPLGVAYMFGEDDRFAGYGDGERAFFWLGLREAPQTGAHIAFTARDRATVDRFHAAALAAGGKDHGAPGLRPHYHADSMVPSCLTPTGIT